MALFTLLQGITHCPTKPITSLLPNQRTDQQTDLMTNKLTDQPTIRPTDILYDIDALLQLGIKLTSYLNVQKFKSGIHFMPDGYCFIMLKGLDFLSYPIF